MLRTLEGFFRPTNLSRSYWEKYWQELHENTHEYWCVTLDHHENKKYAKLNICKQDRVNYEHNLWERRDTAVRHLPRYVQLSAFGPMADSSCLVRAGAQDTQRAHPTAVSRQLPWQTYDPRQQGRIVTEVTV